jgi:ubiquinone/menaquinone biosynthesis C-methylase UbiE
MTDEMLEKARKNAKQCAYANVEFRKGDIEKRIPVEDITADLVYKQLCHQFNYR